MWICEFSYFKVIRIHGSTDPMQEQVRQDCGISFPESTPPRSSDPQLISNSLMQELKDLKGRGLSYSSGTCHNSIIIIDFVQC